ncbi:MAG: carboxypeptidase-like regulatory domain-containing protein [Phycisphaerales bacterium]|jgi:hypothetical protein
MSDWIFNNTVIGDSTSKSIRLQIRKTDGTAKTDAAHTDVTAKYLRPGGTVQTISLSDLAAIDSAWSSGGWEHADNGVYRLDVPDAAIAAIAGGGNVLFTIAVTGCFPTNFEVGVSDANPSTVAAAIAAGVPLANDAITAAKFDESTAFPLKSADTGATAVARTGADSDTLETLSDQIDDAAATALLSATVAQAIGEGKTRMSVTGTLTSNGFNPVVFSELIFAGISNNNVSYAGSNGETISVVGSDWVLNNGDGSTWSSSDFVSYPDLASWTADAPATGTPVVTADFYAVESKQDTAQADLDILTGTDGVTLATAQALYAPAKAGDTMLIADIQYNGLEASMQNAVGDGLNTYAPSKAGDAMALTSGERTSMAAAVWNALTSGMTTVGSIGKKLADWVVGTIDTYTGNTKQTADHTASVAAILEDTGTTLPASLAAIDGHVSDTFDDVGDVRTVVDMILIDTGTTIPAQIGTPAGASVSADILVIDNFVDELESRLTAARAGYLDELAAANLPTDIAAILEDTGTTIPAQIAASFPGGGAGAFPITVTVTDGTDPLENAVVRLTEGANSFALVTDASGNATFSLNAATYTVAVTKDGYQFTPTPTTRTVTGSQAGTLVNDIEMTLRATPLPSADPDLCVVFVDTQSMIGVAVSGLTITMDLESQQPAVSPSGKVVSNVQKTMTEDVDIDGRYSVELDRGLTYKAGNTTLFPVRGLVFRILTTDTTIDLADKKNTRLRPVR